ncbi:MAG: HlyD family efflux transporter periplasmic adaptor subunit [Symploca sp. SIO2E6]|nr:HlyD family efflux transporter periplasmic adaptor subunit [Symploca sp. SIO2E6]
MDDPQYSHHCFISTPSLGNLLLFPQKAFSKLKPMMKSQSTTTKSTKLPTSPLRVVPPSEVKEKRVGETSKQTRGRGDAETGRREIPPTPPSATAKPSPATRIGEPPRKETDTTKNTTTSFPYKPLLGFGIIAIGLGLISQIPVANSVNAEAQLEPAPNSHRVLYTEVPGTLTKFFVEPNQQVDANDEIAIISTEDMDQEIAQSQAELDKATSNFESASSQLNTLSAKIQETSIQESLITKQIQQLQQELTNLPEVEKFNQEIAALQSRIIGVRSQIAGSNETLARTRTRLSRYQDLVAQGAIALNLVEELQDRETSLITQISTQESEINQLEQQIAAKQAEIKIVTKSKQEELRILQNQLDTLAATRETATVDLSAARQSVSSQKPLIKTLKQELKRKQTKQQTHQILKAKQTGLIITPDFHKLLGRTMPAGEPILEIADLSSLVAIIEVPQTDSDIVQNGAQVTFRPLEPGLPSYTTQLEKMELVMQPDPSQQKQLLKVRALVNNAEQHLIPGAKVYASIESEKMPLYQKVQRELMKLFKWRKYGWGG